MRIAFDADPKVPPPADPLRDKIIHYQLQHPPWAGEGEQPMSDTELAKLLLPAQEIEVRLKLLLFGDTGTGKTWSALTLATAIGGKIAMLDPENGSRLYAGRFSFDLLPTDDIRELEKVVRLLAQGGHSYRTLIIDPISLLWSAWQEQWEAKFLSKNTGRAGHKGDWYEMGMKDWAPIKRTWEAFLRLLVNLDMNIILTAREKAEYAGTGDSLRKIGEMPDCEKRLSYWFDSVVRLVLTASGKRLAETFKDRTGKFDPSRAAWEWDLEVVAGNFSADGLAREVASTLASTEQMDRLQELAVEGDIDMGTLLAGARKYYGARSLEELTPDQAEGMIKKLETKIQATKGADQ